MADRVSVQWHAREADRRLSEQRPHARRDAAVHAALRNRRIRAFSRDAKRSPYIGLAAAQLRSASRRTLRNRSQVR
jgi:hypothetical protein